MLIAGKGGAAPHVAQKHLLKNIVGVVPVLQAGIGQPIDHSAVTGHRIVREAICFQWLL